MLRTIAIAGASLAGVRTAESLRREGFDGEIILVGDEEELPYDRPPLSKQFLRGEWDDDRLLLRDADQLERLELTFELGTKAVSLDLGTRRLELDDGRSLGYDALVIATGAHTWRPAGWDLDGIFDLRTVRDARVLRQVFEACGHVAVVGAGFIGCEVAASARHLGVDVTMIEALDTPLRRVVGSRVGEYAASLHRSHGVRLRTGVAVSEVVERDGRIRGLRLSDGELVSCDTAVLGLGVRPATEWLASSGLPLDDGVVCDEHCETAPGVFVAGDVARWPHQGSMLRVEHWTNATEQATSIARHLLRRKGKESAAFTSVPYFWSDQYDAKLQAAGVLGHSNDAELLAGSFEEHRFVVGYRTRDALGAVVTVNWPRMIASFRRLLATKPSWTSAVEHARELVSGSS